MRPRSTVGAPILLLDIPGNDVCADCSAPDPMWANMDFGVLLCTGCCGIHRGFPSVTKSLNLDVWTPEEIESVKQRGNRDANRTWEWAVCPPFSKPSMNCSRQTREQWVYAKWKQARFREDYLGSDSPIPSPPPQASHPHGHFFSRSSSAVSSPSSHSQRAHVPQPDDRFCKVCVLVVPPVPFNPKSVNAFCSAIRKAFAKACSTEGIANPGDQLVTLIADRTVELQTPNVLRIARIGKVHESAWSVLEMAQFSQTLALGEKASPCGSTIDSLKRLADSAGGKAPVIVVGIGTGCLEAIRLMELTSQTPRPLSSSMSFPSLSPPPLAPRPKQHISQDEPLNNTHSSYPHLHSNSSAFSSLVFPTTLQSASSAPNLLHDGTTAELTQSDLSSLDFDLSSPQKQSPPIVTLRNDDCSSSGGLPSSPPLISQQASEPSIMSPAMSSPSLRESSAMEQGHTVCVFVTAGCPLPLLYPPSTSPPRCGFGVPHRLYTTHHPRLIAGGGWFNFHSKEDPLSFTMQSWFSGMLVTDTHIVAKDLEAYLKDKSVIRQIADSARKVWISVNPN